MKEKSTNTPRSMHNNVISTETSEFQQQNITRIRFALIIIWITLSTFVAAMDYTIFSTALTKITSEFDALNPITWVATCDLLTATAFEPLYGKFSDIFGRKLMILFALTIFLIGSVLCGVSTNIFMLIISRAIAGMGGRGLISLSVIIISDIIPLRKRGMYLGFVGATFAASSVLGPLIGGVLTNKVGWRWNFFINVPTCAIAILVIFFFLNLPKNPQNLKTKLARIDYAGTITLVIFITLAVLGLNWGGNDYPWNSVEVIVSLVLSVISFFLFIIIESKLAKEPIIHKQIINRNLISVSITAFFNCAAYYGAIVFIPVYYQVVKRGSAINAGLELLPLLLGLELTSLFSGFFTSKTGNYRVLSWIGTAFGIVGTSLLGGLFRADITYGEIIGFLLIIGLGIGLCVQNNTIAAQASVHADDVAVATSFVLLFQSMGGVIGLAILSAVNQNVLGRYLNQNLPAGIDPKLFTKSSVPSSNVDPIILAIVQAGYVQGLKYMFLTTIAFFGTSFSSSVFLKHIFLTIPELEVKPVVTSPDMSF